METLSEEILRRTLVFVGCLRSRVLRSTVTVCPLGIPCPYNGTICLRFWCLHSQTALLGRDDHLEELVRKGHYRRRSFDWATLASTIQSTWTISTITTPRIKAWTFRAQRQPPAIQSEPSTERKVWKHFAIFMCHGSKDGSHSGLSRIPCLSSYARRIFQRLPPSLTRSREQYAAVFEAVLPPSQNLNCARRYCFLTVEEIKPCGDAV
jgi:hypothetical protein